MTLTGATLADRHGTERLRCLEDSVLNLQLQVLEKLDHIDTMQHEIREIRNRVPTPQELKEQYYEQINERFDRCNRDSSSSALTGAIVPCPSLIIRIPEQKGISVSNGVVWLDHQFPIGIIDWSCPEGFMKVI